MIAGLIFAGHDTTGSFLGFLLAHVIAGHLDPDESFAIGIAPRTGFIVRSLQPT